jgi:dimethylargininase
MFTRAIVCPPAPNFSQGLTSSGLGAPDYERALKQHQAYCATLEQCGLTLTRLEANPDYPDSTFVEDTAVLVEVQDEDTTQSERQAILSRPGAPSRAGEVVTIRKRLNDVFPALFSIQSPGTLDGGDVCQAANHFFIGISERTNETGAQQLAELLAPRGYASSFVDIRTSGTGVPPVNHAPGAGATSELLHLKSGLSYLGDNRLAVTDALAERPEFAGYDLIRVPAGEEYAANCIRVNDQVLVAAGHPGFERKLRELGYQTIALEMSEFQKMDGGLSCLSLRF